MGRNNAIDFLKFFFAVQIVFFHGGNFADSEDFLFSLGAIGVEFFFIVSGFLMASSAFKRLDQPPESIGLETISFMGHKIKGLMPDVYVAWIVAFLVTCWMDSLSGTNLIKKAIMSIFELMFVNQTGLMGFRSNRVTWYLSAMLLAMLILYPILIKTRKTFIHLIALILALFIYGYLYKSGADGLSAPSHWNGHFTNGFLRAAAGLCLGCISYGIVDKVKAIKLTVLGTWLATLAEAGCYLFVSYVSLVSRHSNLDYALVVFLFIGVTITFSRKSYSPQLFQHKCFNWLGILSFDLYLSHSYWSHAVLKLFPQATYWEILPYYLLFVLVFHMGVAGAALASIVAQAISYVFCFRVLKRLSILQSEKEEKKLDKGLLRDLWNKGFATAFQYSVIAIGGIVVQYVINTMGFLYVAGFTATNKLYGVLECISLAMGNTMMVYTSQNFGARNRARIKQGVRASLIFGILTSAVLGLIMILFGRHVLMLFISAKASVAGQVLDIAYRYLFVMSSTLLLLYLVNTYRYVLMGIDRMKLVLVGSIGELVGRIATAMLVLYVIGTKGVYFIEASAWLCADLVYCTGYYILIRRLNFEEKQ